MTWELTVACNALLRVPFITIIGPLCSAWCSAYNEYLPAYIIHADGCHAAQHSVCDRTKAAPEGLNATMHVTGRKHA